MILENGKVFHLQGRSTSYVMAVSPAGDLVHFYYGKKIQPRNYDCTDKRWIIWSAYEEGGWTLSEEKQEYPSYGYLDLRGGAYSVINGDGNEVSQLKYVSHKITKGKPELKEMPDIFEGSQKAETLEVTLVDTVVQLEVVLYYTVFEEYDIICRRSVIRNKSHQTMAVRSAFSINLEIPQNDYDVIYFPGDWAKEREYIRNPITKGLKLDLGSTRGQSSHQMNPFVMVAAKEATEKYGEVFGFSLIYSGNHSTIIESNHHGDLRVQQGINAAHFEWKLESGEEFKTPECVMTYSCEGIGGISREYHEVYGNNLCRSIYNKKPRPILINNWEGTYFDFTEEKLLAIGKQAKEVGIELFVLDDGWFGKRNDDHSSLGDWNVFQDKLPKGIDGLANKMNEIGLSFGLWFEPEMVSPDSDLYRAHPDWAIQVPNRKPAESRSQLILDLSREEVRNYVIESISEVLGSANISYVKWDMNRPMTDMPAPGYNHKYILGLYQVMEALTTRFPEVLYEGCAGGGGRFDAGILAYMPQIWASDNSDAIARLKIQYSTSIGYPISTISAHVTASPNHQTGRIASLKTRADVAYAGIFGYELDITQMSESELIEIKNQIALEKQLQPLMLTGDFYRLLSPYEGNYCAWEMVAKDKSEVFLFSARILNVANQCNRRIKVEGLDPEKMYEDVLTGEIFGGDELMYRGYEAQYGHNDFATCIKHLKVM